MPGSKLVRPVLLLLAVLLLLVVLAGCNAGGRAGAGDEQKPAAAAPEGQKIKLRVGFNIGSLNREFALETALRQHFFEQQGLDVELKGYTVGGQIVQDLAAGNLDVGLVGISPSLAGIAQGADLVVVASQTKNNCPLVSRKGIAAVGDLNGKKVGTPGLSSIQETMLNYLENKEGIKTQHVYGKASDLVGYMEKGEIDAILAWEPVAAQAVDKLGTHYLLDTAVPGAEASEITVAGKLRRENPDAVVRFLRAMENTRQYIEGHMEEVTGVAAKLAGLPESVVSEGVRRSGLFVSDMPVDMDSVKLIVREDIRTGKMKGVGEPDIDGFLAKAIDDSLLNQALKK